MEKELTNQEVWSIIHQIISDLNNPQDFGKFRYHCEVDDEDINKTVKVFEFLYENIVILSGYKQIAKFNKRVGRTRERDYFEYSFNTIVKNIEWDREIIKQHNILLRDLERIKTANKKRNETILKKYVKL